MNEIKHKVISKGGSLTIPADIRREHNAFLGGEAVDLTVDDGKLIIAPHTPRCIFCNSTEEVKKYEGRNVCKACVTRMAKEAGLNG
jgi:transcriptional pleiotropic regulator of transition state genes